MEVLSSLGLGFSVALQPHNLAFCLIGVVLGTLLGVLPGLGPSAGIAILLPVTFGMDPVPAIIMLAGIYYGAMYGGTITSVLINVPGESASVMTCLDGYQLARQGRAGAALGMAAISSFVAGTAGVVALMVLAPWLADFAVSFGPPEYFALMLMGLSTVAGLVSGSPLKALIMGVLGLMLGTVGYDVVTGRLRFTLGVPELADGVHFIIVAIGLFGVGEILASVGDRSHVVHIPRVSLSSVFPTVADWVACRWAILRGTVVGFVVGVLPGAGATVASFLAYALEKKASKHPEKFGAGAIEGVAAPEAANNAASAGALVPLLTLGIPGSGATAVLLGALIMYGVRPGPLLFDARPDVAWGLIASMYVGNLLLVILNIVFIPAFASVLRVPRAVLLPIILALCVVGAYSLNNSLFDVAMMVVFGALGYVANRYGYPAAPLVLALVLGPMMETSFRQSLLISRGDLGIFVTRPLSAAMMAVAVAAIVIPAVASIARSVGRRRLARREV